MAITTAKLTCNDRPTNMTKFYSVNFTSASAGASIPQAQLHTSKNNTSVGCNTLAYVIHLFGSGLQINNAIQNNWMLYPIFVHSVGTIYIAQV